MCFLPSPPPSTSTTMFGKKRIAVMPAERELLTIQPRELKFPFELKKQISCSFRLQNTTDSIVAFKVKTTSPKQYCVRPNAGVVMPQSCFDVKVTMQAQREAPPDMQCKDKFLVQSVTAPSGTTSKNVSQDLFNKESEKEIYEAKFRVMYVAPPQPPSPIAESAEEGLSSPKASMTDNGDRHLVAHYETSKDVNELKAMLAETRAVVTSLTTELNSAADLSKRLQQDLANMVATMDERNGTEGTSKAMKTKASKDVLFSFRIKSKLLVVLGIDLKLPRLDKGPA